MGLLNSTVSKKKTYHTWKVENIVVCFFLNHFKALVFTTKNKLTKRKRKQKQLELLSCSKYWQFLCLLQKNQWLNLAHFTIILSIVILIMENIN